MYLLHQEATRAGTYPHLPLRMAADADFIPLTDPVLIGEVLASTAFHVEDAADFYRRLAKHTGRDFSSVITAFEHMPLVKEGDAHKKLRDEMGAVIAARAKRIEPRLQCDLTEHLSPLLTTGRRIDLVEDVAVPAYASLFSELLGVEAEIVRKGDVSSVFDRLLSLGRRRHLERSVAETLDQLRKADLPDGVPPELALALMIVGRDPLIGSLSLSLWLTVSRQAGRPLREIDFGRGFSATGVPVIDRLAAADTSIGGVPIPKGTRLRLFFDATSSENASEDAGLLFGKGRHLCLGKPLALIAWRVVSRMLNGSPLRASSASFAFRKGDFLFNYPDHAHVDLHD